MTNYQSNLGLSTFKKRRERNKKINAQKKEKRETIIKGVNLVIAFDNGVTGTIAALNNKSDYVFFKETPIKIQLDYTKSNQNITRIDHVQILSDINQILKDNDVDDISNVLSVIERPMVNPSRFTSSKSALRAFESTLVILEQLHINYIVIDSKKWQHHFFGKNTTLIDLKLESLKRGILYFEQYQLEIKKHKDADGLLICKYVIEKMVKNNE